MNSNIIIYLNISNFITKILYEKEYNDIDYFKILKFISLFSILQNSDLNYIIIMDLLNHEL